MFVKDLIKKGSIISKKNVISKQGQPFTITPYVLTFCHTLQKL